MFYFLLALTAVFAAKTNAAGPIFDTDGDVIFGGTSYYVLPIFWGAGGGGLTLAPVFGNQCPLFLGQERSDLNRGIPVRFSNWRSRVKHVPESENLNIEMDTTPKICRPESVYWWLSSPPASDVPSFIIAGPKPEAGEEDSSSSFFQIVKKTVGKLDAYKFVFCGEHNDCVDVGVMEDLAGVGRFVLGPTTPFNVVFEKATRTTETLSKTMSII